MEYSTGNTVTSIVATAYGDSWVLGFSAESLCKSYECLITMCAPETNTAYQLKLENKFYKKNENVSSLKPKEKCLLSE